MLTIDVEDLVASRSGDSQVLADLMEVAKYSTQRLWDQGACYLDDQVAPARAQLYALLRAGSARFHLEAIEVRVLEQGHLQVPRARWEQLYASKVCPQKRRCEVVAIANRTYMLCVTPFSAMH